ncbi:MAG TPA: Ig-like domain-containing protein [Candidatus Baltobacteraceae bacterium]|nr:Ig-like domain-containing protein [Candidatus Baltobacteraceae bacterium]
MKIGRFSALVFFACSLVLAACSNGSNSITPIQTTTPTPVPLATQAPYQAQSVQTLAAAAPVPLPTGAPISGSIALPQQATIPANTQLAVTLQNTAPAGVPQLLDTLRRPEVRTRYTAPSNVSVVSYVSLLFTQDLSLDAAPAFSFTLPAGDALPNTRYYLAFYDAARPSLGWQLGFEGPGTLGGSVVTFSGTQPVAFQAYAEYWFGLYAVSQTAAAPTPAPSVSPTTAPTVQPSALPTGLVTPTPSPAPDLTLSASQIDLLAVNATSTLAASDPNYTGTFGATSSNPNVATVSQTSPGIFTIKAIAVGTTTVTVTEANGASKTCTVTVTTTTIPVT